MNNREAEAMVEQLATMTEMLKARHAALEVLKRRLIAGETSPEDTLLAVIENLSESHREVIGATEEQIARLREATKP